MFNILSAFFLDDCEKGCIKQAVYSNGFQSVYTIGNKISNQRFLGKYMDTVAKMLTTLSTYTSFFGIDVGSTNNINLSQDENVLFIGIVLLRLIDKFNTFALQVSIKNKFSQKHDFFFN